MDAASIERLDAVIDDPLALSNDNDIETILAKTPFLLTRCSSDLRYIFVSEAYARMIGHEPEALSGKKIVDVMGQTGFQTILPHINAVLAGRRVRFADGLVRSSTSPRSGMPSNGLQQTFTRLRCCGTLAASVSARMRPLSSVFIGYLTPVSSLVERRRAISSCLIRLRTRYGSPHSAGSRSHS